MKQLLGTSAEWAHAGEEADAGIHPDLTLLLIARKSAPSMIDARH